MGISELESFGMHWMDGDEINKTLANQRVGVLGLEGAGDLCLRPLSYWLDEQNDALYFFYVLGEESEKARMSDRAESAQFLVYSVETAFNWRSVLLTGTIGALSESEQADIRKRMDAAWQPELFERVAESKTTALYRFDITERSGIKQVDLPPELREPPTESRME